VVGAAVFQVGGLDRHASDQARDHTPVFGSRQNAEDWSDRLETVSVGLAVVTLVAADSGTSNRWMNKMKGGLVELSAVAAANLGTIALKESTGRERPDGSDDHSFPSGHANTAGVGARLTQYNLEYIPLAPSVRKTLDIGLDVMEIGISWARVEAGKHFPSDTLFGLAVGNFCASFFTRAFLESGGHQQLALQPVDGGAILRWQWTQ
jgi:membrane-associated phospholipid phosphatase